MENTNCHNENQISKLLHLLEYDILSGYYEVGSKIPTERELSLKYKVSKTAIHAVLGELARNGFIYVVPRVGAFVADVFRNGKLESLFSLLRYNQTNVNNRIIKSICDVRLYLELPSIDVVIKTIDSNGLKKLKALLIEAEKARLDESIDILAEKTFEFTREVSIISGNVVIPLLFNAFKGITIDFWKTNIADQGFEKSIQMLRNYYLGIEKKNAEICKKAVIDDINNYLMATDSIHIKT